MDHNFHIAVKPSKESHQPLNRKTIKPVFRECRNFGLIDAKSLRRFRLRESLALNNLIYLDGQTHLCLFVFSIWKTQIGKYVAGAWSHFNFSFRFFHTNILLVALIDYPSSGIL